MPHPSLGALLATAGLAWLAGVAAQLQQAELWPVASYAVAIALAALATAVAARARSRRLAALLCLPAAAVAGFALTGLNAAWRLADGLAPDLEGRDLIVSGVVADMPQPTSTGVLFRFEIEQASLDAAAVRVPRRVALAWYAARGEQVDATADAPRQPLRAGQRWRLQVRLKQPHGNANPHGFDYELYLFEQGVRASGYVRDGVAPVMLAPASGFVIARWRQSVRDAMLAGVGDARAAGVLAALAVGDQAAIARADWAVFRDTGVAHLMSISGLHITMFAWLAALLVAPLWGRSTRAMLWLPAQRAAAWAGVLAALGYALFSGFGVPAQRTVWMLATVVLLQSIGRRWPWPLVLIGAAVVVTVGDPWALLQPGFWLSFMAVGLLMSSEPAHAAAARKPSGGAEGRVRRTLRALWQHARAGVRAQAIATVGLAPLTLVFFGQVSLVGFVANLAAIPLVTLVVTPLALLGTLFAPLWMLAAWIVEMLVAYLSWLAGLPLAVWSVAAAPAWAQLAALLGALLVVLPLPWRLRLLALPLVVPLLLPPRMLPPHGQFALTVVDVGQGTAVLLRTASHLLVYDAGPQYSPDADAGERVLLPLLRSMGESRIDLLMLSHRDNDHVGGAAALLAALPVAAVSSSLEAGHPLLRAAPRHSRCEAGQRWQWDGVAFEVLHPQPQDFERLRKPNALSCVLRVQGNDISVLLAGDIERQQEAALVAADAAALRSDLLLVPHHGSRSSSSAAFLDAVQPRIAIIQAGYRNRFGHPAPDVVARYRERAVQLVASAHCGAWTWTPSESAGDASGSCQRDAVRHYWQHRAAPPASPGARD
ncbi:MAG TPA: DNA internalization-related competence protein ComEC/Rec2 [Burkholderiaceae bacterium]|nr:DNA internalization-related competence protein ComEC/Rec2 [Burkholderiaceae bacterium]